MDGDNFVEPILLRRRLDGRVLPMEMHQIRYFLAVAQTLNFTQAANDCHVSQPSLSRAIKKLEEELGGDLFRRERTLTHLTELGRMMLPLLTQSFDSAQSAKTLAASYRRGGCAPLRIALSHTVNLSVLVAPLTELVKAFPGLELRFTRGAAPEIVSALKSDIAELAVCSALEDDWDRIDRWALFMEPFDLVVHATHALAQRNSVPLSLLKNERLLERGYCELSHQLNTGLTSHDIVPSAADKVASDQDALALVEANVAVSIMPTTAPKGPNLRTLTIDGFKLSRVVYLYAVAGRQRSQAANALVKLLRAKNWSTVNPALAPVSEQVAEATTAARA
jgi:DNA-binding transcriptional LysR family regulator